MENLVEAAKLPGPGQYPGANYALEYSSQYKRAGSTWMSTVPRIPKNNRYGGGGEQVGGARLAAAAMRIATVTFVMLT